ncbi:MAG TPA: MFS transporter [Thermoleophilia bacterium]
MDRTALVPPDYSRKWLVLAAVMVGTFMAPLDSSIVNVALPTLRSAFNVPITSVEWVVVAYLLVISTLLLTFGRLADMIGLKSVYMMGFALFTVGSLACALAWSIWSLVGFRVLQALGAAMMFAAGPAIITAAFPPTERGRALGLVGVAVSAGMTVGPTVGGVIVGIASWRWIFLINVPIGIVALLLSWRAIAGSSSRDQKSDPLGAILSFVALLPVLLALSQGSEWGWTSPLVLAMFAVSMAAGAAFILAERKVHEPMLDLSLFRVRLFSAGLLSAMASFVVTGAVLFTMPFYLQTAHGIGVSTAGLLMTPLPLAMLVFGPISGALSDRIGSRVLSTLGLLVGAAAAFSLTGLSLTTGYLGIALRLAIIGAGSGLFQSPNSSAVMGTVPPFRLGVASGTLATSRNVGQVFGVGLAGLVLSVRVPAYLRQLTPQLGSELAAKQALIHAAHEVGWLCVGVCLLGAILSLTRGPTQVLEKPGSNGGGPVPKSPAA